MGTLRVNTIQDAAGTGSPDILAETGAGNAAAGSWGEVTAVASTITPDTAAWRVSTGLTLTAGDWDIHLITGGLGVGTASTESIRWQISKSQAASNDPLTTTSVGESAFNANRGGNCFLHARTNTTATMEIYAKAIAFGASASSIDVELFARRAR